MTSIYDMIAPMTVEETFQYFYTLDKDRLADLDARVLPLQVELQAQTAIVLEDSKRVEAQKSTNAWKRKGAPAIVMRDSETCKNAQARIQEITPMILRLEEQKLVIAKRISNYEAELLETEELNIWGTNLKLHSTKRVNLPTPAIIARFDKREREDRTESQSGPGWTRLTLNHRSSEGTANRDAFYARYQKTEQQDPYLEYGHQEQGQEQGQGQGQEQGQEQEKAQLDMEFESQTVAPTTMHKKLPWWYAKYNIPLDV